VDLNVAKAMLQTIRIEQERRLNSDSSDLEAELAQWSETDLPFLNELALLLLAAVWHGVERELIWLAAGHRAGGCELHSKSHKALIGAQQRAFGKRRQEFIAEFALTELAQWPTIEMLRLLANSYKHESSRRPRTELLTHLGLCTVVQRKPLKIVYGPLPDSLLFRRGLAKWLELDAGCDYCSIVEEVIRRVEQFLAAANDAIPQHTAFGRVSLRSFEG
jgi:hypothetical protein